MVDLRVMTAKPFIALTLVTISLVVGFGVWEYRQISKSPSAPQERSFSTESHSTSAPSTAQDPATPGFLDEDTRDLMLECTRGVDSLRGVISRLDFTTLDQYFEKIVAGTGEKPHQVVVQARKFHVIDPRGETLKLHLAPETSADGHGSHLRARFFKVSPDQTENPVDLPKDLEIEPSGTKDSAFIERLRHRLASRGRVTLEETSEYRKWNEAVGARVVRRNGRIARFRIFFQDGNLACEAPGISPAKCRCLR